MILKRSAYTKTYLSLHISLKDKKIFLVSFKKEIQHYQISFHMPNTYLMLFKLRTLYVRFYLFVIYILFAPAIFDKHPSLCEQFSL